MMEEMECLYKGCPRSALPGSNYCRKHQMESGPDAPRRGRRKKAVRKRKKVARKKRVVRKKRVARKKRVVRKKRGRAKKRGRPKKKVAKKKRGRRKKVVKKKAKRMRSTAAQVARVQDAIIKALKGKKNGLLKVDLTKAVRGRLQTLNTALKKLLTARKIKTEGVTRNTRYLAA